MTYIKDRQDEVLNSLSDLYRLILRKSNNHPELFSELDKVRIENANKVMMKHAKPFDRKQILRRSDNDCNIQDSYIWNNNVSCGYKSDDLNVVIGKIS